MSPWGYVASMKVGIDRRFVLAGLAGLAAIPTFAEPPVSSARPIVRPPYTPSTDLAGQLQRRITLSGLSGVTHFTACDATTGVPIVSLGGDAALPPASVAKSLTALYALTHLGPNYRFTTRVVADGTIRGGVLDGDLVLLGSGDPNLVTDDLESLAAQVRAAGITRIRGNVMVWAGALPEIAQIDASQPVHVGYNPTISGLNLNFNRVYFEWKRAQDGYALSMDARGERFVPPVRAVQIALASRDMPVFDYSTANSRETWTVAQSALGNAGGRWLPVRRTPHYAGEVFAWLLAAKGVASDRVRVASSPRRGQEVARHDSPPLQEIVRGMLKYSTNITAEALGLSASAAQGKSSRTLQASANAMNEWLEALSPSGTFDAVDHSGLGDKSRVSTNSMAQLLATQQARRALVPVLKKIKVSDEAVARGTPKDLNIVAKTGSLNFVSTLAGYVDAPNGRRLSFAVFCADMPRRAQLSRAERERPRGGRAWRAKARALHMDLLTQLVTRLG